MASSTTICGNHQSKPNLCPEAKNENARIKQSLYLPYIGTRAAQDNDRVSCRTSSLECRRSEVSYPKTELVRLSSLRQLDRDEYTSFVGYV